MSESNQRPPVTVEDLLRLKRAERPAPEFWTNFERELRQKQLTALLEQRPWWQELPRIFARRAYLPIGATAILAFTLVSVKYYAPAQLAQVEGPAADASVTLDRELVSPVAAVSSPLVNRSESAPVVAAAAVASAPLATEAASETVELMPLLLPTSATERPSRILAASLDESEAGMGQSTLGTHLGSSARAQTATLAAAELASVPTNGTRRNRLVAQYDVDGRLLNPEPAPPALVRERLARRLGDTENTDRGSRLGRDIDTFSTPMPQIVALRF